MVVVKNFLSLRLMCLKTKNLQTVTSSLACSETILKLYFYVYILYVIVPDPPYGDHIVCVPVCFDTVLPVSLNPQTVY